VWSVYNPTVVHLTYLREKNRDGRGWGSRADPKNSHELIIVNMAFNVQPLAQ